MNYIKFGNLSPEPFAEQVGAKFTDDELAYLRSVWSGNTKLTSADDFHIFDDPAISIHIASASGLTVDAFKAANERRTFNRPVTFYLDQAPVPEDGEPR